MAFREINQFEWDVEKPLISDQISVRNLSHVLAVGSDTWGRPGKLQPVSISVALGLSHPFSTAAATDSVDGSTIHYGLLSKTILSECEEFQKAGKGDICALMFQLLQGIPTMDNFLSIVSCLEIEIALPKASRYGRGVSMVMKTCFPNNTTSTFLRLDKLTIPSIVGVNEHERFLKQLVMATIWIDQADPDILENYQRVEQIVVKTIEESSFETLEAMAEEVAARVIKYVVWAPRSFETRVAGVRVRLEKPSAVTFADAPVIEIYRSAQRDDPLAQRLLSEMGMKRTKIPFPLEGRLDEFLQSSKQD